MVKVSESYKKYYGKKRAVKFPYKLSNKNNIDIAITTTSKSKVQHESKRPCRDLCVFNDFSLMNVIRKVESTKIYISESQKETKSTDELQNALMKKHKDMSKGCDLVNDNYSNAFDMWGEAKVDDDIKFGVVLVDIVCDVEKSNILTYLKAMCITADELGYNYVDHELGKVCIVSYNGKAYRCQHLQIQFEASYTKNTMKAGDFLYHVIPSSYIGRVMKQGLVASNKNAQGFSYPSRVYLFIDNDLNLQMSYARVSQKVSKKFIENDDLAWLVKSYYRELKTREDGKLYDQSDGKVFDTQEFAVLRVDTSKLDNYQFYRDNTFELNGRIIAVYTYKNIPPRAIDVLTKFTVQ